MIDIDSPGPTTNPFDPAAFESVRRMLTSDDPRGAVRQALIDVARHARPSITILYDAVADRTKPEQTNFTINATLSPPTPFTAEDGPLSSEAFSPWLEQLKTGRSIVAASHELPLLDRLRVEVFGLRSIVVAPILLEHELRGALVSASADLASAVTVDARAVIELTAIAIGAALARHHSAGPRLRSDHRLKAILAYAFDTIAVIDETGRILFHSPSFGGGGSALFEDSNGENALSFVHPHDLPRIQLVLGELLHEPGGMRSVEIRLKQTDGSWRYYDAIGTNQLDNPDIKGIVVTAHDVTERKELEQRLNWQALHDPLTQLPNRTLLLNDLGHALARIERTDEMIALLYLDLDGFKEVNDNLGHPAGDQLLILVGERLRACVRVGETVARLGGDEFIVLLEGLNRPSDAVRAAARILEALRTPVYLGNRPVAITSSIGISLASKNTNSPDQMLIEADTALYAAKRDGRAHAVLYSPLLRPDSSDSASDDPIQPR